MADLSSGHENRDARTGRNEGPTPRPEQARDLFVLGESHLRGRESQAVTIIKQLLRQYPDKKVVLFLEADTNERSAEISTERGYPTVGLNSQAARNIYWPVALTATVLQFCNVASAIGDPRYPNSAAIIEGVKEDVRALKLIHGEKAPKNSQVSLLDIQELVLTEIMHTIQHYSHVHGLSSEDSNDLNEGLRAMPNMYSGQIPGQLVSLMERALAKISASAKERFDTLVSLSSTFFDLEIAQTDWTNIGIAKEAIRQGKVASAYGALTKGIASIRDAREVTMAYFIAKDDFDLGVLSCGLNHAVSQRMTSLLQDRGIRLQLSI